MLICEEKVEEIPFMKKRLDFYLSQGIDISYIAMTDPFIIKSNEVDDILDYVDVEDSLCS